MSHRAFPPAEGERPIGSDWARYLPKNMRADFESVASKTGYPVESLIAGRIAWDEIKRLATAEERSKAVSTVIQLWRLSVRDEA